MSTFSGLRLGSGWITRGRRSRGNGGARGRAGSGRRRTWRCVGQGVRFLVEALHAADDAEEFSAGAVLEDVVEFALPLEGGVELDDEGMGALGLRGE